MRYTIKHWYYLLRVRALQLLRRCDKLSRDGLFPMSWDTAVWYTNLFSKWLSAYELHRFGQRGFTSWDEIVTRHPLLVKVEKIIDIQAQPVRVSITCYDPMPVIEFRDTLEQLSAAELWERLTLKARHELLTTCAHLAYDHELPIYIQGPF